MYTTPLDANLNDTLSYYRRKLDAGQKPGILGYVMEGCRIIGQGYMTIGESLANLYSFGARGRSLTPQEAAKADQQALAHDWATLQNDIAKAWVVCEPQFQEECLAKGLSQDEAERAMDGVWETLQFYCRSIGFTLESREVLLSKLAGNNRKTPS